MPETLLRSKPGPKPKPLADKVIKKSISVSLPTYAFLLQTGEGVLSQGVSTLVAEKLSQPPVEQGSSLLAMEDLTAHAHKTWTAAAGASAAALSMSDAEIQGVTGELSPPMLHCVQSVLQSRAAAIRRLPFP